MWHVPALSSAVLSRAESFFCLTALCLAGGVASSSSCAPARAPHTAIAADPADPEKTTHAGPTEPKRITVRGTVVGHDGKPLAMAHVHTGETSVAVAPDGRFAITVPARGLARLYITGVDSVDYRLPLFTSGWDIEVDLTLGTYLLQRDLSRVRIWLDGMNSLAEARPMHRRGDGIYTATVNTSSGQVAYELVDVSATNTINGTMSTSYRYDGDGNYFSIVKAQADRVIVQFDPTKLPPSGIKTRLDFREARNPAAKTGHEVSLVAARILERKRSLREQFQIMSNAGQSAADMTALIAALQKDAAAVVETIDASEHPMVRQALLVEYLTLSELSMRIPTAMADHRRPQQRALARRALAEIPADSPLWSIAPKAASSAVEMAGALDEHRAYLDAVIDTHPDQTVGATLALQLLVQARKEMRRADVTRYYKTIVTRFANTEAAQLARLMVRQSSLRPGAKIPAFSFASMDDPAVLYTADNLRGSAYLIDFWATWCKPCTAQMPTLHETYQKYKDLGFVIVSAAIHDDENSVRQFRAKNWPMPWNHAFIGPDQAGDAEETFDIIGLPTIILVDEHGVIVAINEALRGDQLPIAVDALVSDKVGAE
ncbi:MAG: TlpA family protein disulfide reductase [Proteobacteria bacterium]|nr:TlpA family protein disulfide reductase [Pseudomonadota bacterium]